MADIHVELIDHMGDDLRVVNAARVSMNRERGYLLIEDDHGFMMETTSITPKDTKLIQYLAKHDHWTPFAHCMITLRETVPIFVARQRFKHTVGFVYNEVSRRYVDDEPEFYTPKVWREQAPNVKQGSGDGEITHCHYTRPDSEIGVSVVNVPVTRRYELLVGESKLAYNELLEAGVAPEQARMVLPQSMMTSYYVTGSLAAFARAYKLRSDSHAQREIQFLSSLWDGIIRPLFPVSWAALTFNPDEWIVVGMDDHGENILARKGSTDVAD